jgi:large exoprotein involved in heme utilization and adhesion
VAPAGNITVEGDSLAITNGRIDLRSAWTGGIGAVTLDIDGPVVITNSGIFVDGVFGLAGNVTILAGRLTMENAQISGVAFAGGKGGDVTLDVDGAVVIRGGIIDLNTYANIIVDAQSAAVAGDTASVSKAAASFGDGGSITIDAESITLAEYATISSEARSGFGNGGDVTIRANNVTLESGGAIVSDTYTSGKGGSITVAAEQELTIAGEFSGISSNTLDTDTVGDGGPAGEIMISADSVTLVNGGMIESRTFGRGDGGSIFIKTSALEIHGDAGTTTGIFADSEAATGDAGKVTIEASSVTIDGEATVSSSSTYGSGKGGDIALDVAGALVISGDPASVSIAGIYATSVFGAGDAGKITVNAGSVTINTFGEIATATASSGKGGDITVNSGSIILAGGVIDADTYGPGDAGNIAIQTPGNLKISGDPTWGLEGGISAISSDAPIIDESDVSTGDGGTITIYAGDVTIGALGVVASGTYSSSSFDGSDIIFSSGNAGDISVKAESVMLADGGSITSSTTGSGSGGNVIVEVRTGLEIHGNGNAADSTGIFVESVDGATGNAGKVTIDAGSVTIDGVGRLTSSTEGSGTAGDVTVNAENIALMNGGAIFSNTAGSGDGGNVVVDVTGTLAITSDADSGLFTGISAESADGGTGNAGRVTIVAGSVTIDGMGRLTSSTEGPGNAGDVTVDASSIALSNGGAIFSNATGSGDGGNVVVDVAGTLAITGDVDSELFTGIAAESLDDATGNAGKVTVDAGSVTIAGTGQISTSTGGPGSAGDVAVNADSATIADGAQISSSTSGSGHAGNIIVDVTGTLEVDGGGQPQDATGIVADGGTGNAGTITINAGNVAIHAAGLVSSSTVGSGSGGGIAVHADSLTLTQKGQITTNSSGSGVAGDIVVKAQQVIVDDSTISSDSSGKGASGSVTIDPTSIAITNGSTVSAQATGGGASGGVKLVADVITIANSTVSTESKSGGGGSITITAPVLLQIIDGVVTATVKNGDQNAGNVTIEAGLLILDDSVLSANAFEGNGGNLTITAKGLIASSDSVLTASSEQGIDGLIDVSTLSDDVTSGLVELSGVLVQDVSRLACTVAPSGPQDPFSSVIVHGRGEYDFDPDAPGAASYSLALAPEDRLAASRNAALGTDAVQLGCSQ